MHGPPRLSHHQREVDRPNPVNNGPSSQHLPNRGPTGIHPNLDQNLPVLIHRDRQRRKNPVTRHPNPSRPTTPTKPHPHNLQWRPHSPHEQLSTFSDHNTHATHCAC
ncbi:hypothetical protein GCM10027436_18250 [Actinophytocola sediminis]